MEEKIKNTLLFIALNCDDENRSDGEYLDFYYEFIKKIGMLDELADFLQEKIITPHLKEQGANNDEL